MTGSSRQRPPRVDLEAEWRSMQRRLVGHLEQGTRSDLEADVMEVDVRVYTDPARLEAEREHIFRALPLLVGFSSELAAPGERILFDAAGVPIVVWRSEDGSLRAFLNMCTHRGARLVSDCEPARRLMCPFHGWTYDLEGRLRSMPLPAAFEDVDREARGLVAVPVAEWEGMIFVRARPGDEPIDIEAYLGDAAPLFRALDLGRLELVATDRLEVASNWKLALDTFCEVYHVPTVHEQSLSLSQMPHVAVFDDYGRHQRYSGAGRDFEGLVGRPESDWPGMSYQAVHYLFPNTTIAFTHTLDLEGLATPVVAMFRLFPGRRPGEAITLASTYRRGDEGGITREQVAEMHATVMGIVANEDYRVAREGWPSLEHAPPGFKLVFGRNEALLQRYHGLFAELVGMPF